MRDFEFMVPTRFFFKQGAAERVGEELKKLGAHMAMVVYGKGSAVRSGLINTVRQSLAAAGVEYCELAGVRPNPEVALVREGIALAREKGVDFVLAVGGGSVIDCSKAVCLGVAYNGDVWDLFAKKYPAANIEPLPLGCVLSIPAAGSESSNSCVISNDALKKKCGVNSELIRPKIAFMDPELTFSLPAYQTACGVTDMIAHICERWFSAAGDVCVTDNLAAALIRSIMSSARGVLERPDDYDGRAALMWAGTLAHNGFVGVGRNIAFNKRAGGWESHALEHELSALDPTIAHGAGLAVLMPAWMRYIWKACPERFALFGREVFHMDIALEGRSLDECEKDILSVIDNLQSFFIEIGMPQYLDDLHVERTDVEQLVEGLSQTKGSVIGEVARLDLDDVRAIYLSAFKPA